MDGDSDQTINPQIKEAVWQLTGGVPYWWRPRLEKIAAGIEAGHTGGREASRMVAEVIADARPYFDKLERFADQRIREGLSQHFQRAVDEAFEFAESHRLPLSKAVRVLRHEHESIRTR